jgi:hypothetical protein
MTQDLYEVTVKLMQEVGAERARQDAQWGGPSHDDTHNLTDWYQYIEHQLLRSNDDVRTYALTRVKEGEFRDPTPEESAAMDQLGRVRLVKIAALAIAAVQSLDRKEAARATDS